MPAPAGTPLAAQDRPGILAQGLDIQILRTRAAIAAAGALPDPLPSCRLVDRARMDFPVHERLHQYRTHLPPRLPVIRQPRGRQRQRMRGQVADPHPRQDQEPGIARHALQTLLPPVPAPANPFVPVLQLRRGALEQQAPQLPALPVDHEVPHAAAHRLAVAQTVVAVHQLVEQGHVIGLTGHRESHLSQFRQGAFDDLLRLSGHASAWRLAGTANLALVLRRQRHDSLALQHFQHLQCRIYAVLARTGAPAEMLADGMRQLVTAQPPHQFHRAPDIRQLAARQAPPEKHPRLQPFRPFRHRKSSSGQSAPPPGRGNMQAIVGHQWPLVKGFRRIFFRMPKNRFTTGSCGRK